MEMKRWKSILMMALAFALMIGFSFSAQAGEAYLGIVRGWEDSLTVEMENDTPVLGVEFTLTGLPDVALVKRIKTTPRTKGFMARFNNLGEEGVKVILVSLKGKAISSGSGPIAEIICKGLRAAKANLKLTDVNVADSNNQPLKVSLSNF